MGESAAELCDQLAAEPGTVEGLPGVELGAIDADAALAACSAALDEAPGDPRLTHQYARALERAGRIDEARRLYEWAAEDGYAPAADALWRLAATENAPLAVPPEAAAKAERLAGLASVLKRYRATLPPDPADPLPILAEVGGDPQVLLAWIVENTRLVAYRGELRGAAGVLVDRSGNSLDRALLLAELLRRSGHEVRLARAVLTPEQAALLLPEIARRVDVPTFPALTMEETVVLLQSDPRLDPAEVRRAATAIEQARAGARALFDERLALVLPAIRAEVVAQAAEADRIAAAEMLAALSDHFWVQLRTGTGWRDLDPERPLLGALTPGESFELGKLPADLRQSVVFRVVLELQDSKGRREEKLLEWQGFPAELASRPLQLSHVPRTLSAVDFDWLVAQPDARERLLAVLDDEQGWMPMLAVGEEVHVDRLFLRDGSIANANASALAQTAGRSLGPLFEQADSLLGGGESVAPEPAVPTAEWLEIEVRVPGAAPRVERRTVFDLVGPAARAAGETVTFTDAAFRERALALLTETQILLLGATPSALQVEHIQVGELRALAERLSSLLSSGTIDLDALPTAPPSAPLALLDFARERMGVSLGQPRGVGSPTVVLQHRRLALAADLTIAAQVEIDIVRNEVTAAQQPFDTRLAQGVADTVLEGVALGELPGLRNAAAIHAADLAAGRPWTTLDPADLSRLAAPGLPPDYRARLEADLAAGYAVVTPDTLDGRAPETLAWWRIDPRSGTALGMLSSGGGAVLVEWGKLMQGFAAGACAMLVMGSVIVGNDPAMQITRGVGLAACAAAGPAGFFLGSPALLFASGAGIAGIAAILLSSL